ncbi:Pkinase-domain-containing protein [Backusella circina FSU 941]|nr:Pkinase-domain-containing protein [Backusella circina FSU 941]
MTHPEDAIIPIAITRTSTPLAVENKPTPYHTALEQELDELLPQKRHVDLEHTITDVPRKLSRLDISPEQSKRDDQQQTPPPTVRARGNWQDLKPMTPPDFQPDKADFKKHHSSFGFLQSLSPCFDSAYLYEISKEMETRNRPGFLLGRSASCDLVFDDAAVSKRHCLIYMETGSQGSNRGIRIYLRDMSFNGTYVNNVKINKNDRILLKNGDIVSLRVPDIEEENDWKRPVYRIVFPSSYDAQRCENMYVMDKILGSGTFASVFAAKEKATGRLVAIKRVLKTKNDKRPKLFQSVVQETGTLMSFERHPFVIKIEKIYLEEKYFFLILEYSPDGDLFSYISENKKLPERKARFIFWQLFSAIKFLHNQGVAHRDLKPENVLMISKDKLHIKVADFGLARQTVGNECFTSQCGTPNYVAPEVLSKGTAYDERCDIWSLGVILYICLCGYTPFNESSSTPMRDQILKGEYDFDPRYWERVSKEAQLLVQALMTVDTSERIDLVDAMNHDWMKMEPIAMTKYQHILGMQLVEQSNELLNIEELSCTLRT